MTSTEYPILYYILAVAALLLLVVNCSMSLILITVSSLIATVLVFISVAITLYYIYSEALVTEDSEISSFSSWSQLPLYFGTVIFSMAGINVIMPLENRMRSPQHFIGFPGILYIGMVFVIIVYTYFGYCGYKKFGSFTEGSVTMNLPHGQILAETAKLCIALAIILSYPLVFHVAFEIIWGATKHHFSSHKTAGGIILRSSLVISTVVVAAGVPNLEIIVPLIGSLWLSILGIILPAVIDILTSWKTSSYIVLLKNIFLILFGILGFVTGIYSSIIEMF